MSRFESVYINIHGYGQHFCKKQGRRTWKQYNIFSDYQQKISVKDIWLYQRCFSQNTYNSSLCRNLAFPKDGEIKDDDVYLLPPSVPSRKSCRRKGTGKNT